LGRQVLFCYLSKTTLSFCYQEQDRTEYKILNLRQPIKDRIYPSLPYVHLPTFEVNVVGKMVYWIAMISQNWNGLCQWMEPTSI